MTEDTVRDAAVETLNARQDVDGTLASLKSLCDSLAASWQGAGAASFQEVMIVWDKEATDLLEALENIANMLDNSATATADQDQTSSQGFDGLL
ncbi:WXG100 family type VII secretion target [Glycomyces sp. NPDC047010]|uniref:WXG100 family type VII secretion target n=1 Tax=Glycomyces sp. NPDC047010 TaxID=3155023 RepID=UPI0033D55FF5